MPRPIHLSPSAIKAFLHCPKCYYYAYIEGLRPVLDNESQRMGTNWHALHEVYQNTLNKPVLADQDPRDVAFAAAIAHLNAAYVVVPDTVDEDEWELERTILAASFAGYIWYWQNDDAETLVTEMNFKLPLRQPRTRMPLPMTDVCVIGKLDKFVRKAGRVSVVDYKSTGDAIDADSEFWAHLRLDTQISTYVMAALDLQKLGRLTGWGIDANTEIAGAYYDVWKKPKIRPKDLSQADTAAFLATGTYFGEQFEVQHTEPTETSARIVVVNGKPAKVEDGKKGFAIRETVAMFGARLLADIYERPEFYFARREIPRTAQDIEKFRRELYGMYQTIKMMRDGGWWYRNDQQDSAARHGAWGVLCYKDEDVSDGRTPDGFKRIFGERA